MASPQRLFLISWGGVYKWLSMGRYYGRNLFGPNQIPSVEDRPIDWITGMGLLGDGIFRVRRSSDT
jgi:hypothetical protein